MFPNQKVLREEKKDWIVTLEGNHSYWKKFHAKSDEKQKIFSCTPVTKFQKISTLNICNEAKQVYPKKQKKASTKRYSTSFRSSHPKMLRKKDVPKSFATCLFAYYWNRHQVVDKSLSKSLYYKKQNFLQFFTLKKFCFLQVNYIIKMCWNGFY